MDTLYREEILEHYREPQNFGVMKDYSLMSHQHNPFCGDDIEIYVKGQDVIEDISFSGKGCAISIAASSLLTEFVKKKTKENLLSFSDSDMLAMLGVEISETRKKCALLALWTLRDCLQ